MSKRPFLLLYINDFLGSPVVQAMNDSQRMWYVWLLMRAWENEDPQPCCLPNDDAILMMWAGCKSKKRWDKYKGLVLGNFEMSENKKFLTNTRLIGQYEKLLQVAESKAAAGRASAARRQQKATDVEQPSTTQTHTQTHTQTEPRANSIASRPEATQQEVFIDLPLNDNTEFQISLLAVANYAKLYPAVDVPQEFRGMKAWLMSNREKRKTRTGVLRFANAWLAKKQNNAGNGTHDKNTDRAGKNNEILARKFEGVDC